MRDIAAYMRLGGPCIENNAKCRTMDAASGCGCAQAADEIERLQAFVEAVVRHVGDACDDYLADKAREH